MMRFRKKTWTDEELRSMSRSELEALLQAEETDAETILRILKLLRAKNPVDPADTERAWLEFQQLYNTPEGRGRSLYPSAPAAPRRKRPSLRIVAAVAACLAVLLLPPGWVDDIAEKLDHFENQAAAEDSRRDLADTYLRYQEELANDRMMRIISEQ